MRHIYRHLGLIIAVVVLLTLAMLPPSEKLKRGKDLGGGSTLVYQVDVRPTDPPDTLDRVKTLIKNRLDPNGQMEIDIVSQGTNRIEISMPLPSDAVQKLRAEFDQELEKLSGTQIRAEQLATVLAMPAAERQAELDRLSAGDAERAKLFSAAAQTFDAWQIARAKERAERPALEAAIAAARTAVDNARRDNVTPEAIKPLEQA
ncbi:MAG: hypothetical protein MUE97_06785, partial [Phycisphaerales bacterium]|nr:hypothetical protein [Phycisphaerales bacterium]